MADERSNFYELKKALIFPNMAGPMKLKTDTAILYDMLRSERKQTCDAMIEAVKALTRQGTPGLAERCAADAKMLDICYRHDMDLLREYMLQWGIAFI